jgi:hypothetical protein
VDSYTEGPSLIFIRNWVTQSGNEMVENSSANQQIQYNGGRTLYWVRKNSYEKEQWISEYEFYFPKIS